MMIGPFDVVVVGNLVSKYYLTDALTESDAPEEIWKLLPESSPVVRVGITEVAIQVLPEYSLLFRKSHVGLYVALDPFRIIYTKEPLIV